jgi:hypothetical protein
MAGVFIDQFLTLYYFGARMNLFPYGQMVGLVSGQERLVGAVVL